ncbi:hypothetical protein BDAP_002225 [Binucleata daphniae]
MTLKKHKPRSKKMKERVWNKHVRIDEGQEFWQFDNGKVAKIPSIDERKEFCKKTHEEELHRTTKYVYYKLQNYYYWPGMKKTIKNVIKNCDVCQIVNRKNKQAAEYVTTFSPSKDCIRPYGITRRKLLCHSWNRLFYKVNRSNCHTKKTSENIIKELSGWVEEGNIPGR